MDGWMDRSYFSCHGAMNDELYTATVPLRVAGFYISRLKRSKIQPSHFRHRPSSFSQTSCHSHGSGSFHRSNSHIHTCRRLSHHTSSHKTRGTGKPHVMNISADKTEIEPLPFIPSILAKQTQAKHWLTEVQLYNCF
jgi:hypothetical protein